MHRRWFGLIPLAGAVVLASCGSASVAATVGNRTLTTSQLEAELADVAANKAFVSELVASHEPVWGPHDQSYTALFVDNILSRRITIMRVQAALGRMHVQPSAVATSLGTALAEQSAGGQTVFSGFPRSYQQRLIRDSVDIVELEAALGHVSLTTSGVQAYYRAHPADFESYCGSEILVGTPTEAEAVVAKLQKGQSFAAVAKSSSTQNAAGGGALGCGTESQYASSFGSGVAASVTSLPVGTPSGVVQVPNGFAVFEITSRSEIPFSQAELLAADTMVSHGQTLLNDYLARTVHTANIHVNRALGRIVVQKGVLSVVPTVPKGAALARQIVTPERVG